ncbi:MAG TPA: hypothetical protein VD788_01155 [Candidatus Polarisedimenticolaceae bacterium]|nr:hypothetical protein [Candidatus Polarisedimenticolaceae bacterium]
MTSREIPIIVLAGSDPRPAALPERGRDKHALGGFKAVDVSIAGRPLIRAVVDCLAASGWFRPVYVAGPREVYSGKTGPATIVDTNGSFGENVRHAIECVGPQHPDRPVAFTVCDILPEPGALAALRAEYGRSAPCDLWFPLVRADQPDRLGASAWKPAYRIVEHEGDRASRVLPGHLVIADVAALRLKFLYRLIDLGYRTRNRSIDQRRGEMVRGVLADMLYQDLLNVARLRVPSLTWSVLRASIPASNLLRRGAITRRQLEETLRRIMVKRRHRRAHPERRVCVPIVDALFLARDIDTEEEAGELGGTLPDEDAGVGPGC